MMMERPLVFPRWLFLLLLPLFISFHETDRISVNAARSLNSLGIDEHSSPRRNKSPRSDGGQTKADGHPSSVLVALLESPYTEWMELVDRAGLLEPLEKLVGTMNMTIFAPTNDFMHQRLDPDLRTFLLAPGNRKELRHVLQHHIVPHRIKSDDWINTTVTALSTDGLRLHFHHRKLKVEHSTISAPDSILTRDGVVHGIDNLLVPRSVQYAFAQTKTGGIPTAMLPQGAPQIDPASSHPSHVRIQNLDSLLSSPSPFSGLPLGAAPAPNLSPALAPAPAPGPSDAHHPHPYGDADVADFISALSNYGGYSEFAELFVNLTSVAWDIAKLVNEGFRLTVLAPNDHAMDRLTTEQLGAPGRVEALLMYHVLSGYETEESMYSAVRRLGKVEYSTLHLPFKITAQEADGTVQFGDGDHPAVIYDQDIFTDGRVSIQGIDKVLLLPEARGNALASAP